MSNSIMKEIQEKFISVFSEEPLMVFAPGRINLIGEFTDFNEGYVLPASISKGITFAISAAKGTSCTIHANDVNEVATFDLSDDLKPTDNSWLNYIIGVVAQLKDHGLTQGFNCVFGGNIPIGSGLSSSAALECGIGFGLNELFTLDVTKEQIAKIGQRAEHEYVGVMCGIMDQYASTFGKENHLIRLDCRDLSADYFPIDLKDYTVILFDSQVKHSLASSAYNERRSQCDEGVKSLSNYNATIKSLRDATIEDLDAIKSNISEKVYDRCQHVILENERVLQTCKALEKGELTEVGSLMYQSHDSLQHKFEVSCKELDVLVDFAKSNDHIIGSRMMGGGFGGCTINLIKKDRVSEVVESLSAHYKKETATDMAVIEVDIVNGVHLLK